MKWLSEKLSCTRMLVKKQILTTGKAGVLRMLRHGRRFHMAGGRKNFTNSK